MTLPDPSPPESAATRHLCAAAYIDEDFQQESLREVYYQGQRVAAPSYGFRLIPVLWHCLRARNATIARDTTIIGLLVVTACISFPTVVSTISFLVAVVLVRAAWRLVRDAIRHLRTGDAAQLSSIIARSLLLLLYLAFSTLLFLLIFVAEVFSSGFETTDPAGSAQEPNGGGPGVVLPVLLLSVLFALPAAARLWRQAQLERFGPGRRVADPAPSTRFDEIHRQQQGNTVVYSGYDPFIGSGEIIETSGFPLRLVSQDHGLGELVGARGEGQRELARPPFTAAEIIAYVAERLHALTTDPDPERHLPGLTVTDRIFLAGTEAGYLWPETGAEGLAQIIRHPTSPARHYLACQVVSWLGELVTSVYVHFAVQGRFLYLEITTAALPPCEDRYRVVDQVDGTGPMAYLRAFWQGIVEAPRTVARAPGNLIRAVVDVVVAANRTAPEQVRMVRGYDYGAQLSVRELGASEVTRNHIQTQDILKHKRIVERRVMASVLDFLEARGLDTTEYQQRAMTILNAGVVNTGAGSVYAESAVGQQNQAPSARK